MQSQSPVQMGKTTRAFELLKQSNNRRQKAASEKYLTSAEQKRLVSDYDSLIKKKSAHAQQPKQKTSAKLSDKENQSAAPSTVSTAKSCSGKEKEEISLLDLAMTLN